MEPIELFDVDAAIVFADILLTADAMGIEVAFPNGGPKIIAARSGAPADVERVHEPDASRVAPSRDGGDPAARRCRPTKALIGFSAAPFTLCAYMIEGGTSRDFNLTRQFATSTPKAFGELLERRGRRPRAVPAGAGRAGADVLQLFDTWGGILSPELYRELRRSRRSSASWTGSDPTDRP